MRLRQVVGIALVSAAAVVATDVLLRTSLLRLLQPRIQSPADGAIVTGNLNVSWEGPHRMYATLTGAGQRIDLGLRESPFELDATRFPRPGQYGIELRAPRFGDFIGAERRFMVRRARPRRGGAPAQPTDETGEAAPPPTPARNNEEALRALRTERDQLRGEVEALQGQLTRLREDSADLGQALDELQADTDARLAASEQQREELGREHLLALQENQFLRMRLQSVPACTAWGYLWYPRPQTNPPSRVVVVSDRNGSVFRSELDCVRTRRTDPSGASGCICVGTVQPVP